MPYKDKEKRRVYSKIYLAEHREEIHTSQKRYYAVHREEILAYIKAYNAEHREERSIYRKKLYATHREEAAHYSLMYSYGITLKEYNKILANQNGVCAICGNPPNDRKLAVDHNHVTGKIRGLLCKACNTTLGNVKDSVEILEKAIEYLKEKQL